MSRGGVAGALVAIAAVAGAYFVVGKLALLMAIPPGYATAVWPAAGIALGAVLLHGPRVAPGILVGSLFVNLGTSLDTSSAGALVASVGIAGGIGVGAAWQALVAASLVRRFVGFPTTLSHQADVWKFLLLAGPASCVVSATAGVTLLWAAGVLPPSHVALSWWTWWVGDTIGVMLVAPIAAIWNAEPREVWRRRRRSVGLPLALCATLVITLFVYESAQERLRVRADFKLRIDRLADAIEGDLAAYAESIRSIAGYLEVDDAIDRARFRRLVAPQLERHPGMAALGWNPLVPARDRAAFEARGGLAIVERDGSPARPRPAYVPVLFIEPEAPNRRALGFDLASDPARGEAIERARRTGAVAVSARLELIQDVEVQPAVLVLAAVRGGGGVRGFAVAVLRVPDVVRTSLRDLDSSGIDLQLRDASDGAMLCSLRAGAPADVELGGELVVESRFELGGRRWELRFAPSPILASAHRGWQAWTVLALGLLFTSLLGAFLLVVTGRAAGVDQLVEQQTRRLTQSEGELRQIIQTAHDAFVATDADDRIVDWNPQAEVVFGWRRAEVLGRELAEALLPEAHREAHRRSLRRFLETGTSKAVDTLVERTALHRDGRELPVELTLSAVRTTDGAWRFNAFVRDITPRKESEARILASLREKEVLIKEVHHRVKNNLQVISSLINLQIRELESGERPGERHALRECQSRVQAIALVHEKLYQTESYASVPFAGYARSLADHVLEANGASRSSIALEIAIDEIDLAVDKAVPCALILNELISNALKHAFAGRRRGSIRVELARVGAGMARLVVADDGRGMPEGLDPVGGVSLGMRLISTLTRQLRGTLDIASGPGATVRVTFPV